MRVFGRVMTVVLVLGLLGLVGYGVWNAGFQHGLVSSAAPAAEVVPAPGYYPGYWGFGGFWGFGLIFRALFAFLIIGLIFRIFFGWGRWRGYGRWYGGPGPWEERRNRMDDHLDRWHDAAHGREAQSSDDS